MKVNLEKLNEFNIIDGYFCNEESLLITPKQDTQFEKATLSFRSCVVNKRTHTISSIGFFKFFCYTEKPDLYPDPNKYNDWVLLSKEDGSLCICDFYNGVFSMRTRGQFDVEKMENKEDFQLLPIKYPKLVEYIKQDGGRHSFLLEITTPNNRIVIHYPDVEFTLLAVINKENLKYLSFEETKRIAGACDVRIPDVFEFKNKSLPDIAATIKEWKGKEGLVLCYNDYQNRIKIKSDDYLFKHALRGKLNSLDNLIDLFVSRNCPSYNEFFEIITNEVDFETAQENRGRISNLVDAHKQVLNIISGMKDFISTTNSLTRKDFAAKVFSSYGVTNRASFLFTLKDHGVLTSENIKKLLFQCLKK